MGLPAMTGELSPDRGEAGRPTRIQARTRIWSGLRGSEAVRTEADRLTVAFP